MPARFQRYFVPGRGRSQRDVFLIAMTAVMTLCLLYNWTNTHKTLGGSVDHSHFTVDELVMSIVMPDNHNHLRHSAIDAAIQADGFQKRSEHIHDDAPDDARDDAAQAINAQSTEQSPNNNSNLPTKTRKTQDDMYLSKHRLLIDVTPCGNCPGEGGKAVELTEEEKQKYDIDKIMKVDFFNTIVSDKISLWRSIPDTRNPMCKDVLYDQELPQASVVLIFKNERFSILIRTVYSVILRSPEELLKEVILVDDRSDLDELKEELDSYCSKHFGTLVKIIRAKKRLGLIKAKNVGAMAASGQVVVFLDAHCEANVGWLEPILQRIKDNRQAVVVPVVKSINHDTMAFDAGVDTRIRSYGGFSWSLFFNWVSVPDRIQNSLGDLDPVPSPTMPGGLLAVNKDDFFKKGAYDDDMEVWGAENLEISFRTWMCGGRVEFIPCSHVGHVFRAGHPYNMTGEKGGDMVNTRNSIRLAEVWLDDYTRLYYRNRTEKKDRFPVDVSERKKLRKSLKCHDFDWYLTNVYPEKTIPDRNVFSYGEICTSDGTCIDSISRHDTNGKPVGIYPFQSSASFNQVLSYTKDKLLCIEDHCLAVKEKNTDPSTIIFVNKEQGTKWDYLMHVNSVSAPKGQIQVSETDYCMDATGVATSGDLLVRKCDRSKPKQIWKVAGFQATT